MKRILILPLLSLLLLAPKHASAQQGGFVVEGQLDMPDGTTVGLVVRTPVSYSEDLGSDTLKDGRFTLRGRIGQPQAGTLMTNNLALVEKRGWPTDSIRWTYTEIFLSDTVYHVSPTLQVTGGEVQRDFLAYQALQQADGADWAFIRQHPRSVVSVWLANRLLERAYNLRAEQVAELETLIQENPLDTARYAEFRRRVADGRLTTLGAPLLDFPIAGTDGQPTSALAVLPKSRYILLDFWASWCGICLYSMPKIAEIARDFQSQLSVVAISIDEKDEAWRAALKKHPEPWPQYRTTQAGYDIIYHRYQLGAGVPYYLLLDAEGRVLASPSGPDEIRALLARLTA